MPPSPPRRRRVFTVLVIAVSLAFCAIVDAKEPTQQQSPTVVSLFAWRDSVGLRDTISFVSEETSSNNYRLTLDTRHLVEVIGEEAAATIYERLFIKTISLTDKAPSQVEIHLQSLKGGYCDPSVVDTKLTMTGGGIVTTSSVVRGPRGIMCSLDFSYIERYERKTKDAAAKFNKSTMSAPSASVDTRLTIENIKQYLTSRYASAGGAVTVTALGDNWLALTVGHLRGEVIADKKYWERLQVFVAREPTKEMLTLRLILDARYGSGLAPPSDLGYIDMEPVYTSYLNEYGKSLVLAIGKENGK
jgi:hypothetical protein